MSGMIVAPQPEAVEQGAELQVRASHGGCTGEQGASGHCSMSGLPTGM